MKKEVGIFFLILSVIIILSLVHNLNADSVTGSTITGNASSANIAVSITVAGAPSLTILKPENETYFTATNIEFNFTAFSADTIKYNLDNTTNITITNNLTFNTTAGTHTLYFFGNNSDGNSSKNVTFTVNLSRFIVHYNNYSGANRGASTDFNKSSYEDSQDMSGVVLEDTSYGKISFNQAINLTNDSTYTNNDLDLDINTNISSNFIEVNTTALPNFNKSATISLYNIAFTDPRVLRDGEACDSSVCTEVSYSSGVFIFNVTQFTNYSAGETPVATSPGGGGGGRPTVYGDLFSLDRNQISVSMTPGTVRTENITITNNRNQDIIVFIENLFPDFVVRGEDEFILKPLESKTIPLYFIVRVDTIPDLYLGKIIISSGNTEEEVLIAVEVESEGVLLDVRAEILEGYNKIIPGGEVLAEMRLFNLGDPGRKDVLVEYIIKNYEGNEIFKESESLAIETQVSFIKRISISENTNFGNYVLYVRATYGDKIASASDNFEVVLTGITNREKIFIALIILISIIASIIIYYILRKKAGETTRINLRRMLRE